MADQISDAILDALLEQDPASRVACETLVKSTDDNDEVTHHAILAGEISSVAKNINYDQIVRKTIESIGYDSDDVGYDFNTVKVTELLNRQSDDIKQGVNEGEGEDVEQGAGDQGLMFGYACDETDVLMPMPITFAHRLVLQQAMVRKNGILDWLGPDAKAQVSIQYQNDKPVSVSNIVVSTQHSASVGKKTIREGIIEEVIQPVIPKDWMPHQQDILINPTGLFIKGGPNADCGLTGRKIIVDTYGGMARHGGGAFSGKDPSKVDRSAAYAARHVAKNIVQSGLAKRCEIQIAYAIGVAKPVSMMVNSFGTARPGLDDLSLANIVDEVFDLRPKSIIDNLQLLRPIYQQTASYGHFGRTDVELPWEQTNKVDVLLETAEQFSSSPKFNISRGV